jgi:hypothetical protein
VRFDGVALDPFQPARRRTRVTDSAAWSAAAEAARRSAWRPMNATSHRTELEARRRPIPSAYQQCWRSPEEGFAQKGLARSRDRAALDARLQDYIDRPGRLGTPEVRREAGRAMDRGRAVLPVAPRLDAQLARLDELIAGFDVDTRVQITSDNSTRISIPRVGDLGSFDTRELLLRPGSYTVIGTRDGYRDVRRELKIEPGQRDAALIVQCTEQI